MTPIITAARPIPCRIPDRCGRAGSGGAGRGGARSRDDPGLAFPVLRGAGFLFHGDDVTAALVRRWRPGRRRRIHQASRSVHDSAAGPPADA